MKHLFELGLQTIGVFVILYILTAILSMILYFAIDDKYQIKIKLPKNKKYLKKVDPIYEITELFHDEEFYIIQKWSLQWVENLNYKFLTVLFIYPISVYEWKYDNDSYIDVGDKSKVKALHTRLNKDNKTIGDYFEEEMSEFYEAENKKRKERESFEDSIAELNKVFNENYE